MLKAWPIGFFFFVFVQASASSAQVLPPPPPAAQQGVAEKLVTAFSSKDPTLYASLLDDNVKVYEDGAQIAGSKQEWLGKFIKKFTAQGVRFELKPGYSASGRILFIEYFNSINSFNRMPPAECCWGYDAVGYAISDGKVVKIMRVRGGDTEVNLPAAK
uniref:hypothetical protein n=1 Tax=uncultured Caulobacter sp. TaxID=158749 RepID=UPI0025E09F68|nr:hypothetical protein [uncultured Caulobacter sp.]